MKCMFLALILLFILSGCSAKTKKVDQLHTLRTFAPQENISEEKDTIKEEKRGIIKSAPSADQAKVAYIFTFDSTADVVEYVLSVENKSETFAYDETRVLFRSANMFDVEWGDGGTLMVSLDEKESKVPAPIEKDGVLIMFGQVSSVQ